MKKRASLKLQGLKKNLFFLAVCALSASAQADIHTPAAASPTLAQLVDAPNAFPAALFVLAALAFGMKGKFSGKASR